MQTQNGESAVLPPSTPAANDEFLPFRAGATHSGWDPYEVWRERVKEVYDARIGNRRSVSFLTIP
jgi:hypothetical protein